MNILNFGSLNLDYVYQVSHFVQPGETLHAQNQKVYCGGKGLNQSIALARAGASVYHAGCIGNGGECLKEVLRMNNVNTEFIQKVDSIQGNAVIQVDEKGENCILLFGGSNQEITLSQIDETLSRFEKDDWLILQNEINYLPEIITKASSIGMKIVLNPSPYEDILKGLDYNAISWLLVNQVEAQQISGKDDSMSAWEQLHEKYPSLNVVITLGGDGVICCVGDEIINMPAVKTDVVDTTAAGDTFTGYFLAGIMNGKSYRDSLKQACYAASISVSRIGASDSIPYIQELNI